MLIQPEIVFYFIRTFKRRVVEMNTVEQVGGNFLHEDGFGYTTLKTSDILSIVADFYKKEAVITASRIKTEGLLPLLRADQQSPSGLSKWKHNFQFTDTEIDFMIMHGICKKRETAFKKMVYRDFRKFLSALSTGLALSVRVEDCSPRNDEDISTKSPLVLYRASFQYINFYHEYKIVYPNHS